MLLNVDQTNQVTLNDPGGCGADSDPNMDLAALAAVAPVSANVQMFPAYRVQFGRPGAVLLLLLLFCCCFYFFGLVFRRFGNPMTTEKTKLLAVPPFPGGLGSLAW